MKLLFDANLSPSLVVHLHSQYPGSLHVRDVGLRAGSDAQVWEHAKAEGCVIVSKDTDFRERSFIEGFPPKVVWLDLGNAGTMEIATRLESRNQRWRSSSPIRRSHCWSSHLMAIRSNLQMEPPPLGGVRVFGARLI